MERDDFIVQVLSTIDESDVLTIFFPNLSKALVVDTRSSGEDKATISLVNQVNSMEDRMSSIEKLRPNLGKVRSIAGIPWTKSIRTLKETNVLGRLERRLVLSGYTILQASELCEKAYCKLVEVEQLQWVDLIKGQSPIFKTIWELSDNVN